MLYNDQLRNRTERRCCPKLPESWPKGAKSPTVRNLGMRRINRSVSRCSTSIQYTKSIQVAVLTKVTNMGALMSEHCANRGTPACSISFESKICHHKRRLSNIFDKWYETCQGTDCHAAKSHPMSSMLSTATAYKVARLLIGLFSYPPCHRFILSNLLKP